VRHSFSLSLRERAGVRGATEPSLCSLSLRERGRARGLPSPHGAPAAAEGRVSRSERPAVVRGATEPTLFTLSLRERAGVRGEL